MARFRLKPIEAEISMRDARRDTAWRDDDENLRPPRSAERAKAQEKRKRHYRLYWPLTPRHAPSARHAFISAIVDRCDMHAHISRPDAAARLLSRHMTRARSTIAKRR